MRSRFRLQSLFVSLATVLCGMLSSGLIQASPVAFAFRGTVNEVFDGLATLSPRVVAGTPFRGVYVFDSTTPNTAEPGGEGELGLYHHDRPPAGVLVHVGGMTFHGSLRRPDFDIIVNNDFGFAGADEYGFFSYRNRAIPRVNGDLLQISWFASTFEQLFLNADLPLDPPDLSLLGGGEFKVYGECTPCASPAAFFRITGPITSLVEVGVGPWWQPTGFDVSRLAGDLGNDLAWGALVPEPHGGWACALGIIVYWIFPRSHATLEVIHGERE